MDKKFLVTLRDALSPEANVLYAIGTVTNYDDAFELAMNFINDPKRCDMTKVKKSYYQICTDFSKKDPVIVGIDYGSYNHFVFIHEI